MPLGQQIKIGGGGTEVVCLALSFLAVSLNFLVLFPFFWFFMMLCTSFGHHASLLQQLDTYD